MVLFNGEEMEMSYPALMNAGNFYVPIAFFSEIFDMSAEFANGYVTIAS
jgi:hypothetical protein